MIVLGVTGQTGSGKTTLLKAITSLGGITLDCDALYWRLLREEKELGIKLIQQFGDICDDKGAIDRKKLGNEVFSSPEKLQHLNEITHPIILKKVDEIVEESRKNGHTLLAIDAIALVESGLSEKCTHVIAVVSDKGTRMGRIQKRDSISEEYAKKRVESQKNDQFYKENSDFCLENNFKKQEEFLEYAQRFLQKILN